MDEFHILLEAVFHIYGLNVDELTAKTRKRDYVELRYACFNLLLKHSSLTLEEITPLLKIDRTTGYNAIKVNENSLGNSSNNSYLEKYYKLEKGFIAKLETPERLIAQIEGLKKEKNILEDKIKNLKKLLDSKLIQV